MFKPTHREKRIYAKCITLVGDMANFIFDTRLPYEDGSLKEHCWIWANTRGFMYRGRILPLNIV